MTDHRRTWFDERGLVIAAPVGERALPFYAGAMHYWRVPRAHWAACLRTMHAQGFTIVESYVPWRVHAPAPDTYDWSGDRDLRAFITAAGSAGLSVVLRVGPHVNAELTSFGIPDFILADVDCQARTSRGTPAWMPAPPRAFPIPSYASRAFHAKVAAWYVEVARVVGDGPVVAIGVDNEAQLFFRAGAYDLDYHPDAITWWRESTGIDGDPPRDWDPGERAKCISWVRFKDHYLSRALGEFAKALDAAGFADIARFHNLPPGHHALSDLRGIQHAIGGPVGIDAYTPRADFRRLRRSAASLVGNASPVPIAMEVGVGFFPWFPPLDDGNDPTRERDHLLSLLAVGARGFNLFMAVERDRYYGAAISKRGQIEKHAQWIHPLISALAECEWPTLRRHAPIALIDTRADLRFGLATTVVDPLTPVVADLLGLGPGGPAELGLDADAITARKWQDALASALELAQVPYTIVDESASEDELARYTAVIAPTLTRIDRGLWSRLRSLAEHKRAIVVIGPTTPTHDELGQPLPSDAPPKRIGKIRDGSLDDIPGLAADLAGLAGDHGDAWQIERPDDVRCFAHADPTGAVRAVFVVSDAPKATSAVLLVDERTQTLSDPLSKDAFRVAGGRVTIAMPPRGVRLLLAR